MKRDILTLLISTAPPYVPLLFIIASLTISPWWNVVNNALSDLGHPLRGGTAAILFNVGLTITGYLMGVQLMLIRRIINYFEFFCLNAIAIALILVGTLNESFGYIHFIVSMVLFLIMLTYIMYVVIAFNAYWLVVLMIITIALWYYHLGVHKIKGAAIPEIFSIGSTYAAYTVYTLPRIIKAFTNTG